ncbi:hypothetical protein GGF37_003432 [Kickxella alabastrina]|nr:hypothetical protein GGF37_003432 [Kickxella alabastrina]
MVRHHEPMRSKGLREMPIGQGFTVYLIDEYCTSTFCPACESRMEKFYKIDDPRLKNPKHKYHGAMVAAASNFVAAATSTAANTITAVATAVSAATTTATDAASFTGSAQQSCNQWMPICPQSADIIRWIGGKGWSKQKNSYKVKQQLWNELAERNRKHCVNL